jgi:uracil-DNA glycosylase
MTKLNIFSDAQTLEELNKIISNCKKCSLYKTKTTDVPGSGNPSAEIVFIGEAPGKEEDLRGEPFVGAAGKFLEEMLLGIGLSRKDVFITNVLKHRPPNNRDPEPAEIEACWPYLIKQLEMIQPKLIIFLGRHALNRFFPELKISEVHGQAFRKKFNPENEKEPGDEQVFLALYHPAAALYNGSMRQTLITDFNKIPALLNKINHQDK